MTPTIPTSSSRLQYRRIQWFFAAVLFLITGHATAQIATWANKNLNSSGTVNSSTGTGTLSRGPGITYRTQGNAFASDRWTQPSEAAAVTNGDYVQITVDTTGHTDIALQITELRSGAGPGNARIYYSSTGTAGPFTAATTFTPATTTDLPHLFDFSAVTALHNNPNVVFRIYAWGNVATNAFLRFKNIVVGAAPIVTELLAIDEDSLEIAFSKPMGISATVATNYSISGPGIGTTSLHPDSIVALTSAGRYRLNWLSPKEMKNGENVTVTATAVLDSTGIIIGIPNSETVAAIGVAPSVQSIQRTTPALTNSPTASYQVTFSESVQGVDTVGSPFDNFSIGLVSGSVTGTSVALVSGGPSVYTVDIATGTGDGEIRLNLSSIGSIADLAGNPLSSTYSGGSSVLIDKTGPAVAVGAPSAGIRNAAAPVSFEVTFNDAASIALTSDSLSLITTGNAAAAAVTVDGDSPTTRSVTLSGLSGDGTIAIGTPNGSSYDPLGNPAAPSGASTAVIVDNTDPDSTATLTGSPFSDSLIDVDFTASDANGITGVQLYYRIIGPPTRGIPPPFIAYPGGPFTTSPIVFDITQTGGNGTYEIYTVATDAAGNEEDAPPTADSTFSVFSPTRIDSELYNLE